MVGQYLLWSKECPYKARISHGCAVPTLVMVVHYLLWLWLCSTYSGHGWAVPTLVMAGQYLLWSWLGSTYSGHGWAVPSLVMAGHGSTYSGHGCAVPTLVMAGQYLLWSWLGSTYSGHGCACAVPTLVMVVQYLLWSGLKNLEENGISFTRESRICIPTMKGSNTMENSLFAFNKRTKRTRNIFVQ